MFQSIQSSLFRNQVETSWTFGTQPNIGMGALENLWIAIPPLNEQELIDEYLISELKNFDAIIAKTIHEIELLKEYKTALISEVVTGKVDVRDEKLN
jgi:type I restriction enzyme S subunit